MNQNQVEVDYFSQLNGFKKIIYLKLPINKIFKNENKESILNFLSYSNHLFKEMSI